MHTAPPFEPLLDATEVAHILRLHPQSVLRLARSGKLPCLRYARRLRFRRADIAAWIETHSSDRTDHLERDAS